MHAEPGVIFRREDCAGVGRRLLASFVDGLVLLVFAIQWRFVCWFVVLDRELSLYLWLGSFGIALTAYLGLLKRSPLRTLGYRLAGIEIVGIDGNRAGLLPMLLRSTAGALWVLSGSMMYFLDLAFIRYDEQRRTLRDKLAGTIVIRAGSVPVGSGTQTLGLHFFLGWTVYFREVKPRPPAPQPVSAPVSATM
jgi:uncharacterized RDD family membrane protein YckC